jgi:hypothetical protein
MKRDPLRVRGDGNEVLSRTPVATDGDEVNPEVAHGLSALQGLQTVVTAQDPVEREAFLVSENVRRDLSVNRSGEAPHRDELGTLMAEEDVLPTVPAQRARGERTQSTDGAGKENKGVKNKNSRRRKYSGAEKGKGRAEEAGNVTAGGDERALQRLIKHLKRQLKAAEEGRIDVGRSRQVLRMGSTSKEGGGARKRQRHSQSGPKATDRNDPLGPEWAALHDVPPVEINRLGEPTGAFWEHMQPYVFDRGAYIFPWDVDWNKQSEDLKSMFILRVRELYPGPWESKGVMALVGNNLRERRNRLKKRFRICSNPKAVSRPRGCSVQSWEEILKTMRDPKKKAKSDLCKLKADQRLAANPFSHRTGRGGYKRIIVKFVSGSHSHLP